MNKRIFIGVDEAGYGPNLGPLLIGGSAWCAPQNMSETDLCEAFSQTFRAQAWNSDCNFVPLGDSKKLYQAGGGIATLETGLLAMFDVLHGLDATGLTLQDLLAATCHIQPGAIHLPWYDSLEKLSVPKNDSNLPNPLCSLAEVKRLSAVAAQTLSEHEIELLDLRCVVVAEPQFNSQVSRLGSKGQLLSKATLQLVAELLKKHSGKPCEVYCDRQGGRKNYLPVLLDAMPDAWFTETLSSRRRCSYRSTMGPPCDIHFSVGGDSFPPTALASMLAKYLRERFMEAFNMFWKQHVPRLKPTAGYPQDARRFRAEIEARAAELSLATDAWWRCR